MDCCELSYHFYTNVESPVWDFGDNTTSTEQNPKHEYSNINSYSGEGTPTANVKVLSGSVVQFQQQVAFPEGIWIGKDCQHIGVVSTITNSINPSLLVLPGLNHVGKSISIKGSVTMDLDYTFDGCDFCMNPAARMLVMTSTLSFIDGTILHEAPCKFGAWYGVELRSGSITGTNATFEGAYNAIVTRPSHNMSNTVIRLTECHFERNYLGINVSAPLTFAVFRGNRFGNEGAMLDWPGLAPVQCNWSAQINKPANLQPFAGIYAETPANQAAITIGFPSAPPLTINRFVNLSNGIYLNDANGLTIQRCQFKNIISGAYPNDDGMGIALFTKNFRRLTQFGLGKASTDLTFENCVHAVLVEMPQFSSGNVLLQSILNNMNNVQHGYTLRGGITATFRSLSYIRHNKINYTGIHGILCENISPDSRMQINFNRVATTNTTSFGGVWIANFAPQPLGTDYRIQVGDNLPTPGINFEDGIYGGERGISIAGAGHILVQNNKVADFALWGIGNSVSPEDDFRCNTSSSATGQYSIFNYASPTVMVENNITDISSKGIAFNAPSNNSIIKCNQIGSHDVGLYYDAFADVGNQLAGNISAGNTWNGTYSSWAAQNFSTVIGNQYFYRAGEINPTQIISTGMGWFTLVTAGVTCAAASCPAYQSPPRAVSNQDLQIANGTLNPGGLSGYLLKRFLYNDLLYYPSLTQGNNTLQAFQGNFAATNGGNLVGAEKSLVQGFNLTPGQQAQWKAAANSLDSIYIELANLDSLLQNGANQQAQQTQRSALWLQDSAEQVILKNIYASNLSARATSAGTISQTLNTVSPNTQWESNEKELNTLFVNTAFIDQAPNATQTAQILQIAQQCSDVGGPVVYRARNWYRTLTGVSISVTCIGVVERSNLGNTHEGDLKITVSPNPAHSNIRVDITGIIPDQGQLQIFDVLGKLQYTTSIHKDKQGIEISTQAFSNGIYYCRLTQDGKVLSASKFVVHH